MTTPATMDELRLQVQSRGDQLIEITALQDVGRRWLCADAQTEWIEKPDGQVELVERAPKPAWQRTGLECIYRPTGERVRLAEHANIGPGWLVQRVAPAAGQRPVFGAQYDELDQASK